MLKLYTNIKNRRKELGITQQELAEAIGYSGGKSMISKIESGKVDLPQSKIKQIAEVLQISPGDLFDSDWDQDQIDSVVDMQDELSAQEDALEEEIKSRLATLTTEQLARLNDILGLELNEKEMLDLFDYAKFIVSKRKAGDYGKA